METLVKETLERQQVKTLLDMANVRSKMWEINNHLSIYKGYFITWDGERHEGCIVCHYKGRGEFNYYFMEVELKELGTSLHYGHKYEPTYHALIPISERKRNNFHCGNTKELCDYIVNNAMNETWDYYKIPMTKDEIKKAKETWSAAYILNDYTKPDELKYTELDYWYKPLTESEKNVFLEKERQRKEEIFELFINGNLPKAEDDIWYEVLCSPIEAEIIKILRSQGYSVCIDGERDSFGWVTRGIFVNGEMMCLY